MPGLADLLESYRNWRGRQEWQQGYENQRFAGGDPGLTQLFDEMQQSAPVGSLKTGGGLVDVEDWLRKVVGKQGIDPQELMQLGSKKGFTPSEVNIARLNLNGTNERMADGFGYKTMIPVGMGSHPLINTIGLVGLAKLLYGGNKARN
jgi:hypothetical protein